MIRGYRSRMLWWLAAGCGDEARDPRRAASTADTGGEPSTDSRPPTTGDDDDDDPPPCEPVVAATARPGAPPTELRLDVTVAPADAVWAVCTAPADPEERVLAESTGAAEAHSLVVRGLLPDTEYTCAVHAACGGEPAAAGLRTGLPDLPALTATLSPGAALDGAYTLFNTQRGCGNAPVQVLIADPEGRIRWSWATGPDLRVDVDAALVDAETIHVGGGWGTLSDRQPNRGVFRTMDLSWNPLVERALPDYGLGFNHHSERMPDGRYLTLTGWSDTDGARTWPGVGVEVWDPAGGVTWSWNSQGLVDQGLLAPPGPLDLFGLAYHANAVAWRTDALGDAVWISSYGAKQLWRIDRATGERTHVFGLGGDLALVDPSGAPLDDVEWPHVQHGPDWTADDRVLLYDNGVDRPGTDASRVAEYALDLVGGTATLLWTWSEPGWSDPILGDADHTAGGHVLVAQGFSQCLDLFTPDTSEIVELVPPAAPGGAAEVVWRLTWASPAYQLYRAQRYGGCEVFANGRYCPDIDARIAELESARSR